MQIEYARELTFELLEAAGRVQRRLDGPLANIKGITFSEYQLLLAIQAAPGGRATRVDLAAAVGLTPSGVTRALKPLEKLGFVKTTKDDRDARRSMAQLTSHGMELTNDATGVVNDTLEQFSAIAEMSDSDRHLARNVFAGISRG